MQASDIRQQQRKHGISQPIFTPTVEFSSSCCIWAAEVERDMAEKAAVLWSEHSEKLFVICFLNTGSECKCDGQEGGFKPLGPF